MLRVSGWQVQHLKLPQIVEDRETTTSPGGEQIYWTVVRVSGPLMGWQLTHIYHLKNRPTLVRNPGLFPHPCYVPRLPSRRTMNFEGA